MAERDLALLAARLPRRAFSTLPADLLAVSMDLWPRHILGLWSGKTPALPAAVVWPESSADVQQIVAFAHATGTPLVPYGAGSSVVGGATAAAGQVVVDCKRMARVLALDEEAWTATAEAGIIGERLERTLGRQGFTQGHLPSSIYCSTLGGWIAARGAGQLSSRYGKIEDQVVGGAVVVGDGTLVRLSPSPVRTPLLDAFIGSEGTLGIWTEATVRIARLPEARAWRGLEFSTLAKALAAARAWLAAGLSPAVVRIYDPVDSLLHRDTSTAHVAHDSGPSRLAWLGAHWPNAIGALTDELAGACRAVVGVQGEAAVVARDLDLVLELARAHDGKDLGAAPGEAWWRRRYAVSYKQSNALRAGVAVDTMEVACPWENVLPVYRAVRRAGRAAGAQVLAHFSHVYLDGASIYFTYAMPASGGERAYDALWETCLAAAAATGGNVSHHHGIGRLKAAAFRRAMGGALGLMRAQAKELDPAGILNPDVFSSKAVGDTPPAAARPSVTSRSTTSPSVSYSPVAPPSGAVRAIKLPPTPSPVEPDPRALCVTAAPTQTLAEVEAALCKEGRTLGAHIALLPALSVLEAARRGLLLRKSPQLHVIEPVVMGVDGEGDAGAFRFIPAPRAAMGGELWTALLRARVERVWLRTLARGALARTVAAPLSTCLALARDLARDEDLGGADIAVHGAQGEASLTVTLGEGPLFAARSVALARWLDSRSGLGVDAAVGSVVAPAAILGAGGRESDRTYMPAAPSAEASGVPSLRPPPSGSLLSPQPLPSEAVFFAATWANLAELALRLAACEGVALVLSLADTTGGAGFVYAASGVASVEQVQTWTALVAEASAGQGVSREPAVVPTREPSSSLSPPPPSSSSSSPPPPSSPSPSLPPPSSLALATAAASVATARVADGPATPRALRLRGRTPELDNCTYCPKMSRFACPTAVAHGSETLTPRELMLTVNLDRRAVLRLSPDAALRLYSCVDCRGCTTFCYHGNDVAATLMQARAELFVEGGLPLALQPVLATLRATGRLPDRPAADDPALALNGEAGAPTLLFLGCQNTAADSGSARAALRLARRRFGAVDILRGPLSCCGHPLWRWGDRQGFRAHARAFAAQLRGARRVVVDDPGCAYALGTLYPLAGVRVPSVVTTSSLFAGECAALAGAPRLAPADDEWSLRYLNEPTLRVLTGAALAQGSILEGEAGSCGGMLLPFYDPWLAERVARQAAADILGGGAERILVTSATVRRRLRAVDAPLVDLLDLWCGGTQVDASPESP